MASAKKKHKKRRKMNKKEKIISAVVVLLGTVAVIFMGLQMVMSWRPFSEGDVGNSWLIDPQTSAIVTNPEPTSETQTVQQVGYVNILCLAFDEDESLTDVIMLVSLNKETNQLSILQIPRDSFVYGLGYTNKINEAYSHGGDEAGMQNVIKCINEQFQLRVDYYVTIGVDDIVEIVDNVGGIPINVPEKIIWSATEVIEAGDQVLNGEQAEWFVRYRKAYVQKDIGRAKTQRIFLAACMQKAKNLGLTEVVNLIPTVSQNMTTNLSIGEMTDLASLFLNVELEDCKFFMVPGDGSASYDGLSVYSMYKYSTADLLNQYFRYNGEYIDAEDLDIYELKDDPGIEDFEYDDFQSILEGDVPDVPRDYDDAPEYYN